LAGTQFENNKGSDKQDVPLAKKELVNKEIVEGQPNQ